MKIGVPRESLAGENRVAATPKTVPQLLKLGYEVLIEHGAGARSAYPDSTYLEVGAQIVDASAVWDCDIVMALNAPTDAEIAMMHSGATLITFLAPRQKPELTASLAARGVTGMSMDMVPRISRA